MKYSVPPNPNKGRMAKQTETETPTTVQVGSQDEFLNILGPEDPTPAPTVEAPVAPLPQEPTKEEAPKKPKEDDPQSPPKRSKKGAGKKEEDKDKEKFSVYLPPKLAMVLRMAHVCTRESYSRITEDALTDMLHNRYQCNSCTAKFSISGNSTPPTCCPVCGEKKFFRLRVDTF